MIFIGEGPRAARGAQDGDLTAWKQSKAVARHVEWSNETQERGTENKIYEIRDANCEMRYASCKMR